METSVSSLEASQEPLFKANRRVLPVLYLMVLAKVVLYGGMNIGFGLKYLLMAMVGVFLSRELEILLYSHSQGLSRSEGLENIKKTCPEVTALILVLAVPAGVSLSALIISLCLAVLVAKVAFGGFGHNIFNPAAVGVVFLREGYRAQVESLDLSYLSDRFFVIFFGDQWRPFREVVGMDGLSFAIIVLCFVGGAMVALRFRGALHLGMPLLLLGWLFALTLGAFLFSPGFQWEIPGFQGGLWPRLGSFFLEGVLLSSVVGLAFCATDPVTSPRGKAGQVGVSLLVSVVTFYLVAYQKNPYGIYYGILFGNFVTPVFNLKCQLRPAPRREEVRSS